MTITREELAATTFTDAHLMIVAHSIVRALKGTARETDPGPLAKAPDWMIADTGERVRAIENGESLDPEAEHERWCASKRAQGYVYGPVRNDNPDLGQLTHPLLVPYEDLDLIQRLKDLLPNGVIAELSGREASCEEPLPTPEEARAAQQAAAAPAISRLRDSVRAAITRSDGRAAIYADIPDGTGSVAYETVKAELEGRGWTVTRDSSAKNESFLVLTSPGQALSPGAWPGDPGPAR